MKKWIASIIVLFVTFAFGSMASIAEANTQKVGVYFSELNEEYAKLERPAGSYTFNGQKKSIDRKDRYSSIWDKSLKVYHSLERDGFNVDRINERHLNNQATLQEYDTIVFPYSVLMTHQQRQVLKQYVRDGGGVVFLYAGARNQAETNLWKTSSLDLTPMIYKTESWIWQWDNLSEIFSAGFVSDNHVKNLKIGKGSATHPIIKNAERQLGRSISFRNTRSNGEWLELSSPYSGYVVPLLAIEQAQALDGKGQYVQKGKPIALANEYGHGRVVTVGFKIYDFLEVDTPGIQWRESRNGAAYDGTEGREDARYFLNESVKWTAGPVAKPRTLKYDVALSMSNLQAYQSPRRDYVIYGTAHIRNTGDTPVRGTLLTEVFAPNGQRVAKHERYLPGRTPYTTKAGPQSAVENSHSEKFQFNLPLNSASGQYEIRTTFVEGHRSKKGYNIRATSTMMNKRGTAKATFAKQAPFKDVNRNDSAYASVENLASLNVIRGYGNGIFRPDIAVTRKQAVDMIMKATNTPIRKGLTIQASDIAKNSPDYDLIATAVHNGLLEVQGGKVRPYANMTRGEMANALVSGFKFEAIPQHTFNDVSTSVAFNKQIHILSQLGVAQGYTETNTFRPGATLTRKNFSAFLDRSLRAVQQ